MSIRFTCPVCKTAYMVNDRDAGKKSECKQCGQRLQVPAPQRSKTILGEAVSIDRPRPVAAPKPIPLSPMVDQPSLEDDPTPIPIGYLPPIPRSRHLPKPVIFGCIGGVGLLGFVALAICLFRAFFGGGRLPFGIFAPDREPDLLAWAPPDSEVVVGFDLKELNQNVEFRDLLKGEDFAHNSDDGIAITSVDKIIVTGHANKKSALDTVVILGLNKPFDPNKTPRSGKSKTLKKDGKSYLQFESDPNLLFNPEKTVVVMTNDESRLTASMNGKSGEVRLNDDLRQSIRRSSGPIWAAAVGPAAQPDTRGFFPSIYRFSKDPDPPPLCLSTVTSSKVRSDRTDFTIILTYTSREKAKLAADQMTEGLRRTVASILADKNPSDPLVYLLQVIYDTNKFEQSGSTVVNTFQLPHRELKRLPRLLH